MVSNYQGTGDPPESDSRTTNYVPVECSFKEYDPPPQYIGDSILCTCHHCCERIECVKYHSPLKNLGLSIREAFLKDLSWIRGLVWGLWPGGRPDFSDYWGSLRFLVQYGIYLLLLLELYRILFTWIVSLVFG